MAERRPRGLLDTNVIIDLDGTGEADIMALEFELAEYPPALATDFAEWQRIWALTLATNLTGAANATFCK